MKAKLPHFPMYARDFPADGKVVAMTTEQVGAYALLLCFAWLETPPASIPNDDAILAAWVKLSVKRWERIKGGVLVAWELRGDRWFQKRLESEHLAAVEAYEKARNKGTRGAAGRWHKHSAGNAQRMAPASDSDASSLRVGGVGEGLEPAAQLAAAWSWTCTRRDRFGQPSDRQEHKLDEFREALRRGLNFDALKSEIENSERDRNEHLWQFWKRIQSQAPSDSLNGIREFLERGSKRDAG